MALSPIKYGIREVCDVGFYSINPNGGKGKLQFVIDSAKTSTLEGASTTVYAQGGKGNPRLIAWEGERTLTFTVEDALISKEGLELLTGDRTTTDDGIIEISANRFAGYYYVEAKSLMRKEDDGEDYPFTIVLPRVKVQSNFSIAMAPTGDPSTFNFVMDAFPGYTSASDKAAGKKLLCRMAISDQIASDDEDFDEGSGVTTLDLSTSGSTITATVDSGVKLTPSMIKVTIVDGVGKYKVTATGLTNTASIALTDVSGTAYVCVTVDGISRYTSITA